MFEPHGGHMSGSPTPTIFTERYATPCIFQFSFLKHLLNDFHILSIDPGGAPLLTVTPYLPPPPTTDAEFGGWGVSYSSDTSHIELIFITISTFSNHVSFPHSS